MAETVRIPRTKRKKTSIYIDGDLWKDFVTWCHNNRTSTCHILEPLVYALLKGSKDVQFSALPKVDLTLNISREVKRARRRETVPSDAPLFQDWGSHVSCNVCPRESKWVVNYAVGWDKVFRVYCCGYHVRRYRRMVSLEQGFPQVNFQRLYVK